jgi:hypothetical protein
VNREYRTTAGRDVSRQGPTGTFTLLGLAAAAVAVALQPSPASADGTFAVMTYNVRGLPPLVIENREDEISKIGPRLEDYHTPEPSYAGISSVVGLQEVFYEPYYNSLVNAVDYQVETSKTDGGPANIGDGLVILSDFALQNVTHVDWNACHGTLGEDGSDCDTDKGYTYSRIVLQGDQTIDLYTLHADAGQDDGSREARRDNITQLSNAIEALSPASNAVIVLGDTNSLYTRVGNDNLQSLLSENNLTDVWVQLEHESIVPEAGPAIDDECDTDPAGGGCELVDKILYRDGANLVLAPQSYNVLDELFSDGDGDLSDHKPVTVTFDYVIVTTTTTTTVTSSTSSTSTSTLPERPCGDPVGVLAAQNLEQEPAPRVIQSSDALFVLKVAVEILDCALCTCDVNNDGKVASSDALRVLKKAVGQNITLICPDCP